MRSDDELVRKAGAGDTSAFEQLYARYRDWVHGLAWRFTQDPDLALDVVQETFAYLVQRLPTLRLTASLTTFLYPAVRHLSLNALRARRRFIGPDTDLEELPCPAKPDEPANLDDLQAVLALLPQAQRQVVLMRFVDAMSLAEIATSLGIPEGTVKSRLHHALTTLREDERTRRYFFG